MYRFSRCPMTCTISVVATGFSLSFGTPILAATESAQTAQSAKAQLVSQDPKRVELLLVSYAVTKAAYDKIIPKFAEKWKRETAQEVVINGSYGGSGSQTRAILDGLEADVSALALALDTKRLEKAGLIQPGWEKEAPNDEIVTRSVITFVTRPGNPKGIRTWADLTKPGIQVITAKPQNVWGARWNFLGLWGSVSKTGGSDDKAKDYVSQVYRNAPLLPKDAREATDAFFKKNQGDVLLNYENEMILASQKGETGFFTVIPQTNISIDNPVAVVDKIVDKKGTRKVAEAFVQFLSTPDAQREFASVGFRPGVPALTKELDKKFPRVTRMFTVNDFGGWDNIQKRFFDDGSVFDQIYSPSR